MIQQVLRMLSAAVRDMAPQSHWSLLFACAEQYK